MKKLFFIIFSVIGKMILLAQINWSNEYQINCNQNGHTYYTTCVVNLYDNMSTESAVSADIPSGEAVEVTESSMGEIGWWEVCYKGKTGWVKKGFLTRKLPNQKSLKSQKKDNASDRTPKPQTKKETNSLYDWNKKYLSPKYGYTIKVPESFTKTIGTRPHIDLKFVDDFGSSIIVNVSSRQLEEYKITAHDYTSEFLEKLFKQGTPNAKITYSEKLLIDGEKAFLIEIENAFPNLRSMDCYIFHKDVAIVITGTCEKSKFTDYKALFKNSITSLKFKK